MDRVLRFLLCRPRPPPELFIPHNYEELRIDSYGFPGDAPMDLSSAYTQLAEILKEANVAWCPVGDVLLVHYGVPKIISALEICVDDANIQQAQDLLSSHPDFCTPFRASVDAWHTLYRAFPRFKVTGVCLFINLLPASLYGLDYEPLSQLISKDTSTEFPLLRLATFTRGLAAKALEPSADSIYSGHFIILLTMLIDGMDIDEEWCAKNLPEGPVRDKVLSVATRQVKLERLGKWKYQGWVTTYIETPEMQEKVHLREDR
ncbi:hypothetical protein FISHEDRAFT_70848 [Fistulina hepatica ATCC 64428]|uniref:Uncharacterized protein n=1 Tax=Fistulina hepatica ATCC 64428 TaxID=1128425 RepID=A0A0D7AH84_9AGAR|nr:hypothetical protein FISHEDRAFT_70848 [Fistulina hepatica ATCC 64428]